MLCEKCKHNTATVHYQQTINGKTTQYNLCEQCANEIELTPSFDNLFTGFLTGFANPAYGSVTGKRTSVCPCCGLTIDEICSTGKLGCSECYSAFSDELDNVLKNIHGTNIHNGKFPQKSGAELRLKHDISELKFKLQKAVENEEYEEAAKLRDKIKELERSE